MADQPATGAPFPQWGSFAVTVMMLALATMLFVINRDPAVSGGLAFAATGYWLPTRPNRAPPA